MEIVRTKTYTKAIKRLRASGGEIAAVEKAIARNPELGDIIRGAGGCRKIRFAIGNKGKSGSGRAIYFIATETAIYMMTAYGKGQKADLTSEEKKALKAAAKALKL